MIHDLLMNIVTAESIAGILDQEIAHYFMEIV